jgi:hypothetical protein
MTGSETASHVIRYIKFLRLQVSGCVSLLFSRHPILMLSSMNCTKLESSADSTFESVYHKHQNVRVFASPRTGFERYQAQQIIQNSKSLILPASEMSIP